MAGRHLDFLPRAGKPNRGVVVNAQIGGVFRVDFQVVGRTEFGQGRASSLGGGVIVVQVSTRYHDEGVFLARLLIRFLEARGGEVAKPAIDYLLVHDLGAGMLFGWSGPLDCVRGI